MLRFFKYSGPIQFFFLFAISLLIRVPFFIFEPPLLIDDLKHLALGEKMSAGFLIYRDVIDNTSPISAFVYCLITYLFGKSLVGFHLISGVLIFTQAIIFKSLCNSKELMTQRGDIPALVYIICSSVCYDFFSLSPCLISLTFVLLATDKLFKHIRNQNDEEDFFFTGFYIGIAYLCFSPSALFFLMCIVVFLLYSRSTARYYLLYTFGFIFPIICVAVFFLYSDGLSAFYNHYLTEFQLVFQPLSIQNPYYIVLIFFPIILITILGFFTVGAHKRFINFQIITQQIIVSYLVITLFLMVVFFSNPISNYMFVIPYAAFFMSNFILITRKNKLANVLIIFLVLNCVQVVYNYLPISYYPKNLTNYCNQLIFDSPISKMYNDKKIAVLGNDFSMFINNKQASSFYNWQLAAPYFNGMEYYAKVETVYKGFASDMPDVIIDQHNVLPKVFDRIPFLQNSYKKTTIIGVYEKR